MCAVLRCEPGPGPVEEALHPGEAGVQQAGGEEAGDAGIPRPVPLLATQLRHPTIANKNQRQARGSENCSSDCWVCRRGLDRESLCDDSAAAWRAANCLQASHILIFSPQPGRQNKQNAVFRNPHGFLTKCSDRSAPRRSECAARQRGFPVRERDKAEIITA